MYCTTAEFFAYGAYAGKSVLRDRGINDMHPLRVVKARRINRLEKRKEVMGIEMWIN